MSEKYQDKSLSFEQRAKDLVAHMTLEEKAYQTLYNAKAIERLGIKAYNYWNEGLHGVARAGVATVFPQAIGLAATFDEDLIYEVAKIISDEARAKFNMSQKYHDYDIYKGLTIWSPNINIFRDPRWGRGHETYGEDPYLTSRLGIRFVEGLQGDDDKYLKTAACAKHFAVHSGPEDERHRFDAKASVQDLRETYLPAFKALVKEAGVETVMGAYNRTNGEPCCGSTTLLVRILRKEWGFSGHVTSDCWAIRDFFEQHKVCADGVESAALAMNAGCDLNCGNVYGENLIKAIDRGLLSEKTLTKSVERLFVTRMKLGLFDDEEDVPYNKISYSIVDCDEHIKFNEEVARRSLTLLKNKDNILPLDKKEIKTIGVVGPNANSRMALVGNYEGIASRYITVLEGIQDYCADDVRVLYSPGCDLYKDRIHVLSEANDSIAEAKAVAECSDIILACMGLDATIEGEEGDTGNEFAGGDKKDIRLPGLQEDVLRALIDSKKPVILVLLSGSALTVGDMDDELCGIIQAWYPGARGGKAIAELIFGEFSPEGKLPVTFYKTSEELPDFRDYSMRGRTYRYMKNEALYPFGFGLSYTDFTCEDVSFEKKGDANYVVRATIQNTGVMSGGQSVQVYIKAPGNDVPNHQLKGLKKVRLSPGESEDVIINLTDDDFGLYDEDGIKRIHAGEYEIYIGMSQPDSRSIELLGTAPEKILYHFSEDKDINE